ncbi:MAG: cytidylate kinase-like family protein [Lachnospiraceae bacterium]|nr:cytidylate kinase-like family protein [Lachnospiraceae bacterium]
MSKKIITISREFGSGGRYIGEQVAKALNIPYYDKKIIAKAAEQSGLSEEFIEKKGEYSPIKSMFAYAFVGRDSTGASLDDYLFSVQRDIILDIAAQGSCVIVGRCADYILKEDPSCINIFIHGNMPEKTARIMSMYEKTEAEAVKLIKETDKKRAFNYKYYTDQKWGIAQNYTLCLNSSQITYEKCIEIIADLAK